MNHTFDIIPKKITKVKNDVHDSMQKWAYYFK